MVVTERGALAPSIEVGAREHVIWHDLECGGYRVDMPLWRELAAHADSDAHPGRILDVGAGSGRVSLELARAGHRVSALDLDPLLLAALDLRAEALDAALRPQSICADACTFELQHREFALCIVPMQTIQLLGGSSQRISFLRRARAHLRPGALLACAIVTDVDPFDCASGDAGPSAERARIDGTLFVTRAVRVSVRRTAIRIERERRIFASGHESTPAPAQRDVIELDRLTAARLERDALAAGLHAVDVRTINETDEHVGSTVVILGV
jgi:SAM-dependent methyltransferase